MPVQHSVPSRPWAFLILGIVLRCVALNQPLIDAHLFRQCQTADAVKSLIEAPAWELSARASWLGDTDSRLVQEFPLYNYLVAGVYRVVRHLDASGKLTSIILWAVSFLFLQQLWRRLLTPQQTFWANFLFVFSPLSIFFGQAFMPEMLVRACEFMFLASLLSYGDSGRISYLLLAGFAGAIGMLVKTPEFAHLYLVAAVILFEQERWQIVRQPRYWLMLLLTAACVKGWAAFVDATNSVSFPEWTASASASGFLGSWRERVRLHPYVKYAGYLIAFALTPAGLLLAGFGVWRIWRLPRQHQVLVAWTLSVLVFYLVWGPHTAGEHSYYHLPALGVACALFGLGAESLREALPRRDRFVTAALALAVIAPAGAATYYLFRQDRVIYAAAIWVRDHVPRQELVLFDLNHRAELDYAHVPTFSYYAQRPVWVYSRSMTPQRRIRALETSTWAVVTHPPPVEGGFGALRRLLRGMEKPLQPDDVSYLEKEAGFKLVAEMKEFAVYKKIPPSRIGRQVGFRAEVLSSNSSTDSSFGYHP